MRQAQDVRSGSVNPQIATSKAICIPVAHYRYVGVQIDGYEASQETQISHAELYIRSNKALHLKQHDLSRGPGL